MKKFEFSLGRMLNYKETMLGREKDILQELHGKRMALETRIEANEVFLLQVSKDLKESTAKGVIGSQLQLFHFKLENTRNMLVQLSRELADVQRLVNDQTEVVLLASQEVSGLEKLEEKQREEYNYEAQKEEEGRIAELVSSKYAAALQE